MNIGNKLVENSKRERNEHHLQHRRYLQNIVSFTSLRPTFRGKRNTQYKTTLFRFLLMGESNSFGQSKAKQSTKQIHRIYTYSASS